MDSGAPLVLVVDDMTDGRDFVIEMLEGAGFRVAGAADGTVALSQAFSLAPSLIILDLSLPEVDGWEVARRLKGDQRTREIPILALSAFGLPIHRERALAAGCVAFMAKPCPPSELLAEVRKLLAPGDNAASGTDST